MSIYIKSLRHLARDLARAARAFAEDYNTTGYEHARAAARVRGDMRAQLINELCADWGREIEHSLDANVAEWGAL